MHAVTLYTHMHEDWLSMQNSLANFHWRFLGVYLGAPVISERRKGEETSARRQPSLSADLRSTKGAAQSFWSFECGPHICSYRTQQCQGWICLLRGQRLQVHHLVSEGSGGNLGHVSRPGSQDNLRVGQPEHKTLFAHRKCLEVPDPLDGGERDQERCLNRQIFKLNRFHQLKENPLKSRQDDREIPGGHNGWPRRI